MTSPSNNPARTSATLVYITREGEQFGPYNVGELQGYLTSGDLLPEDLAWHEGLTEWMPLNALLQSAPSSGPLPEEVAIHKQTSYVVKYGTSFTMTSGGASEEVEHNTFGLSGKGKFTIGPQGIELSARRFRPTAAAFGGAGIGLFFVAVQFADVSDVIKNAIIFGGLSVLMPGAVLLLIYLYVTRKWETIRLLRSQVTELSRDGRKISFKAHGPRGEEPELCKFRASDEMSAKTIVAGIRK